MANIDTLTQLVMSSLHADGGQDVNDMLAGAQAGDLAAQIYLAKSAEVMNAATPSMAAALAGADGAGGVQFADAFDSVMNGIARQAIGEGYRQPAALPKLRSTASCST